MSDKLKGKVAVITGSGRGIGKEIAMAMAKEGSMVVTNDVRPEVSEAVATDITNSGGQAISFLGDISRFDIAQKLIQTAVDHFGKLDILVNNAAVASESMVWDMTEEKWDQVVGVSLKGSFNCIRHASSLMNEQRWGRILNATSSAWLGAYEACHYCAAKAGIVGLTRAVARELGQCGITCNAYSPHAMTMIASPEQKKSRFKRMYESGFLTKQRYEELISPRPSPETIAPLLIYLCTDEAADINGQVFDIEWSNIGIYSHPFINKCIHKDEGLWTVEELIEIVPKILLSEYKNPAYLPVPL